MAPPLAEPTLEPDVVRTPGPATSAPGSLAGMRTNLLGHLKKGLIRRGTLLVTDLAAVALGVLLLRGLRGGLLGSGIAGGVGAAFPPSAVSAVELAVALVISMWFLGGYRGGDRWREPVRVFAAVLGAVLISLYADLWTQDPWTVAGRGLVVSALLGITLVALRSGIYQVALHLPRPGLQHRVLEIRGAGSPRTTVDLGPHYETVAAVHQRELRDDLEGMEAWLAGGIDTVVVSGQLSAERFSHLTDFALTHGCRLLCAPRSRNLVGVEPKRVWFCGESLFELTAPGLRASQLALKRVVDLVGSAILLVVFAPLMVVLALLVRLDSPGPILFRHRRVGYGGRLFELLKFRSMRSDAEEVLRADPEMWRRYVENDFKLPEREDPRLTRLGRLLRRSSLDELPQLVNVLLGHMSLVGPRPVVEPELQRYRGRIPTLLSVKPGLTGLWQVQGRSEVMFPERAELDLEYVRNWSLLQDLLILAMTVPAVLFQRGAH